MMLDPCFHIRKTHLKITFRENIYWLNILLLKFFTPESTYHGFSETSISPLQRRGVHTHMFVEMVLKKD